ncbi:hypothetical protein [Polaromonas sp. C04]|uniref:hypothetical protein n=1 Tax=Polaromonas sp. C04 TaxID=1945857 RepID=UPI0009855095|nr:hypothetical protein [Polaromonas sp. C04]OOG58010.1 hypothetical protein B0E49_04020 [Polaromonas sp. C04]
MPIDITKFSEAQLSELNRKIVARLRYLQEARMQQQMQSFRSATGCPSTLQGMIQRQASSPSATEKQSP